MEDTLYIFLSSVFLLYQFIIISSQEEPCLNIEDKTVHRIGLQETQFWTAKTLHFEHCAKLCVRQKRCNSITFDTQSRMCELNTGTRTDTQTRTGENLLYSEFKWWPSSLDKNCYSRPCAESESCIPVTLLGGSAECSYTCIQTFRDVCPLPRWGVSNGRTVGSVNTYVCGKGTTGGGTAVCLPNKQWDKDITPTCTPIFGQKCSDNGLCSEIDGKCSDQGVCQCEPYRTYNDTQKQCEPDCGEPPEVDNAQKNGSKSSVMYTCKAGYRPSSASSNTITCTQSGWEPTNSFSCVFACGDPLEVPGATVTGSGSVRKYTCNAPLYNIPGKGSETIICDESLGNWTPTGFKCGGIRLILGQPEFREYRNWHLSGYLEMFIEEWRAISPHMWTWNDTKVACRQRFGLEFGGTYYKNWYNTSNPSQLPKISNLNTGCHGDEEILELCPGFLLKSDYSVNELALTCFKYGNIGNVLNTSRKWKFHVLWLRCYMSFYITLCKICTVI
ncbi:uncharacterized protein LOC132727766 [Ruditapes philippinarum]|uniref:uncharacterized protein LOC132727766 n=1 Tax=Ruditapes philippinarum TaxID=129788 RepID=UPI00295AA162|nr:uncharacterized protein LOC132727766 [Ruditapes philippinarum]